MSFAPSSSLTSGVTFPTLGKRATRDPDGDRGERASHMIRSTVCAVSIPPIGEHEGSSTYSLASSAGLCDRCEQATAVFNCTTCEEDMCEICEARHSRRHKDKHEVTKLPAPAQASGSSSGAGSGAGAISADENDQRVNAFYEELCRIPQVLHFFHNQCNFNVKDAMLTTARKLSKAEESKCEDKIFAGGDCQLGKTALNAVQVIVNYHLGFLTVICTTHVSGAKEFFGKLNEYLSNFPSHLRPWSSLFISTAKKAHDISKSIEDRLSGNEPYGCIVVNDTAVQLNKEKSLWLVLSSA